MPRHHLRRSGEAGARASLDDGEVADAVIAMSGTETHPQVAARLAQRFGSARAWSADMVRAFTLTRGAHGLRGRLGERGAVERQPALRAFVDARIGRMSLDELTVAARRRFGQNAISRTGLYRYIQRERQRLPAEARGRR